MPAISEIKSQGNNEISFFKYTEKEEQQGDHRPYCFPGGTTEQ
ncbi:TPA: hypothetical protein ACYHI5_002985 [Klebsiella pneumoniae]